MSKTTIPKAVQIQLWVRAGGRCQFPGCNKPLWKDTLTFQRLNLSYIAHIVADSPKGRRGSKEESELLKASLSNLMLLCGDHHRLIDGEHWQQYPTEWLREKKQEHESRIERQTGLQSMTRTHVVLIGTRVGDRRGDNAVNEEEACAAVLPARYPATDHAIRVDMSDLRLTEQDPIFWQVARTHVERCLAPVIAGIDGTGRPINHLSVFSLAAIPVLIYCGSLLGDIIAADVYHRHRLPASWDWRTLEGESFDYLVTAPEAANDACTVAINLSLSGPILQHEINRAIGHEVPTYGITAADPSVHLLRAKEQLELFTKAWRRLLSRIRQHHGAGCEIHLFAAVPAAVAIEIGRALLPKVDPKLHIYNLDGISKVYRLVLSIA